MSNAIALRAHLEGVPLQVPPSSVFDMAAVRANAKLARELRKDGGMRPTEGQTHDGQMLGVMPVPLVYNMLLPELFKFAYLCDPEEVPPDLSAECVWALEMFIGVFKEASIEQLHKIGYIAPNDNRATEALMKHMAMAGSHDKAASLALKPEVDEPVWAVKHLRAWTELEKVIVGQGPAKWSNQARLGCALARTRDNDVEALELLERWHMAPEAQKTPALSMLITMKMYLARLYRRAGTPEKATDLEAFLVKWFKKNPFLMRDEVLVELFRRDVKPGEFDPVLKALGGEKC